MDLTGDELFQKMRGVYSRYNTPRFSARMAAQHTLIIQQWFRDLPHEERRKTVEEYTDKLLGD